MWRLKANRLEADLGMQNKPIRAFGAEGCV